RELPRKPDRRLPADTMVLGVDLGSRQIAFALRYRGAGLLDRPASSEFVARGNPPLSYYILADGDAHAAAAYLETRQEAGIGLLPANPLPAGPERFVDPM